MAKRLTVKTIRAKNKVEIAPDASDPAPSAPSSAPKLAVSAPEPVMAGGGVAAHLQNPYEMAGPAPQNWTVWAILSVLSTLMSIALVVLLAMEWQFYHGGFEPVFMKPLPVPAGYTPPAAAPEAPAAPAAVEEAAPEDAVEEAPAELITE